jgi:hypothetical protein
VVFPRSMPMDAMCMTMILLVETAELCYSVADHLINPRKGRTNGARLCNRLIAEIGKIPVCRIPLDADDKSSLDQLLSPAAWLYSLLLNGCSKKPLETAGVYRRNRCRFPNQLGCRLVCFQADGPCVIYLRGSSSPGLHCLAGDCVSVIPAVTVAKSPITLIHPQKANRRRKAQSDVYL